ncbi:MAG: sulfatase-like hydrolase/transferase [Rhodobiaceae bacterium]|nr:sulfatase-like hydrolase/transferase [Rhodobiaceae bacterium]MCC0047817.1 sulfatase-like hydrolase/transferase [Rhodobiaceae bacterium]
MAYPDTTPRNGMLPPNRVQRWRVRWSIALFALLIAVMATTIGFFSRVHLLIAQERPVHLIIYLGIWGFSILCLIAAAMQPNRIVRWFWAITLSVSVAASQFYYDISGSEIGPFDVVSLYQASHEAGRAFDQYAQAAGWPLLIFVFSIAAILAWPASHRPLVRRAATAFCWVPVLPMLVIGGIVVLKEGGGSQGMPQHFAPIAVSAVTLGKIMTQHAQTRETEAPAPANPPAVRNIVFLVDESIRGDYIDWRPGNPFTPEMAARADRFIDFGPAASGGNCSHYSNALLRLGGARNDIIGSVTTNATIWKYAKAAGYRTVFIDAQAPVNKNASRLQNFMTVSETSDIDRVVMFDDVPVPQLDFELLKVVEEELAGPVPVFIYANKNGAHFPYDHGYPEAETKFHPTDTENGVSSTPTLINSYRNNIRWSVDRFFGKLLDENDFRDTLVMYTSDHGQNFQTGRLSHCTVEDPDPREGLVPLMAITGHPGLHALLEAAAVRNHARASHFQIVPTLLELMGESAATITASHGPSLFDKASQEPGFTSGDIFGLFNDEVRWTPIDLGKDYLEPEARGMGMNMAAVPAE